LTARGSFVPRRPCRAKLVDRVAYRDEVYDDLKAKTGRAGSKEPFKQIALKDYAKLAKDGAEGPKKDGADEARSPAATASRSFTPKVKSSTAKAATATSAGPSFRASCAACVRMKT
jgi:hypothetical protein